MYLWFPYLHNTIFVDIKKKMTNNNKDKLSKATNEMAQICRK